MIITAIGPVRAIQWAPSAWDIVGPVRSDGAPGLDAYETTHCYGVVERRRAGPGEPPTYAARRLAADPGDWHSLGHATLAAACAALAGSGPIS